MPFLLLLGYIGGNSVSDIREHSVNVMLLL